MKTINKKSIDLTKVLKITLSVLLIAPSVAIFLAFFFVLSWDDITYLDPTLPNFFTLVADNFLLYLGKLI
jgi:hypothetical protein